MVERVKRLKVVGGVRLDAGKFGSNEVHNAFRQGLKNHQIGELKDLIDDALTVISPSDQTRSSRVLNHLKIAIKCFEVENRNKSN